MTPQYISDSGACERLMPTPGATPSGIITRVPAGASLSGSPALDGAGVAVAAGAGVAVAASPPDGAAVGTGVAVGSLPVQAITGIATAIATNTDSPTVLILIILSPPTLRFIVGNGRQVLPDSAMPFVSNDTRWMRMINEINVTARRRID